MTHMTHHEGNACAHKGAHAIAHAIAHRATRANALTVAMVAMNRVACLHVNAIPRRRNPERHHGKTHNRLYYRAD